MKRALIALVVAGAAYVLAWPVPIDPVAWQPPEAPSRTGVLAPNEALRSLERISVGAGLGPEAIAIAENGWLYTGTEDGVVTRMRPDGAQRSAFADTGGRPLGIRATDDGALLVADAKKGLLHIDSDGAVTTLVDSFNGKKMLFVDDLAIAGDGTIYFSDASSKFTYGEDFFDVIEHGGHGRLFAFYPDTNETRLLIDGLHFANGVALGPDDTYVLANETATYRTQRYWLTGDKRGTHDTFIENLPGFPDNIRFNGRDLFWLAINAPRNAFADETLFPRPFLLKVVLRLPPMMRPQPQHHAWVLGVNLQGDIVYSMEDTSESAYPRITSALEHEGSLYIGGLTEPEIGRIASPHPVPSMTVVERTAPPTPSETALDAIENEASERDVSKTTVVTSAEVESSEPTSVQADAVPVSTEPEVLSPAEAREAPLPTETQRPPAQVTEGRFLSTAAEEYFGRYANYVRMRVGQEYGRLVESEYTGGPGRATLAFLVQATGELTDVRTVDADGDEAFVRLCQKIASAMSPLDPVPYAAVPQLPEHLVGEPVAFRFELEFAPDARQETWSDAEEFDTFR